MSFVGSWTFFIFFSINSSQVQVRERTRVHWEGEAWTIFPQYLLFSYCGQLFILGIIAQGFSFFNFLPYSGQLRPFCKPQYHPNISSIYLLLFRSSHNSVFWFLVFWSLDFLSVFFRLVYLLALQNVNKNYIIFS